MTEEQIKIRIQELDKEIINLKIIRDKNINLYHIFQYYNIKAGTVEAEKEELLYNLNQIRKIKYIK